MDINSINWGSVADWASATGSLVAVIVALYLSRAAQRVSMSVTCGLRVLIDGRGQTASLASIFVVNTGERPFRISTVAIRHGLLKKSHGIIKIGAPTEYCDRLLQTLNDGDQSHFGVPIDSGWVEQMSTDCRNRMDVESIRITIYCTNGQRKRVKPEKALLKHIYDQMKKKQTGTVNTGTTP